MSDPAASAACPWCGEPPERPCVSWRGVEMTRRHADVFAPKESNRAK